MNIITDTIKINETPVKEFTNNQIENITSVGGAVLFKVKDIKNLTPEQLKDKMEKILEQEKIENTTINRDNELNESLTDAQRTKIKEEKNWSDEIVNEINSMKEYEIYKDAKLIETEINGKKCLIKMDIDWQQKDAMGRTNESRIIQGLSPIGKNGKIIELHHIGQHSDSPLAELTPEEHRGKGNDTILHNKTKESEIDRQAFTIERNTHWEARVNKGGNQ